MIFERCTSIYGIKIWLCTKDKYSFIIGFDMMLGIFSASWRLREDSSSSQFIGERIHPETKLPYFTSRSAAIRACENTYRQLTNPS